MKRMACMVACAVLAWPVLLALAQDEPGRSPPKPAAPAEGEPADPEPDAVAPAEPAGPRMDNRRLGQVIGQIAPDADGGDGRWVFTIDEVTMLVVTDEAADRMRIMADIGPAGALGKEDLLKMMHANFDRALDARYALFQGRIWSVFIHPLGDLTPREFVSGARQVVGCVKNYGTSYSSGELQFGGGDDDEVQPGEVF